ncbi:MAG TPA: hypothetical protein PLD25_11790 [Chloroflexota bacterium]|nr:hypothetical protein [Chloroflexota bacterium]
MKRQPILNFLVPLVALLALIAAGAGLFWQDGGAPLAFTTIYGESVLLDGQGLYRFDWDFKAPIQRGTDAVTLFVSLPLLLVALWRTRRGSLKGGILLIGVLSYFLYYGASLALSMMFNSLFLVYTALFSASFFAFVYALTAVPPTFLAAHLSPNVPRRGMAIFLVVTGLGVLFIWMSEIIGPLLQGDVPAEALGPYTTMVTHALDMAIIAPACVLTAVYLRRREPVGYLLAAPLLILCALIGVVVIGQTLFQTLAGITFPIGVYIGMIGSWVVLGAFAIWLTLAFFRSLSEPAAGPPDGTNSIMSFRTESSE